MKHKYSVSFLIATLAIVFGSLAVQADEADDKIEASAKSSYVFRTYLGDDVKIDAEQGVVTLSGKVVEPSYIGLAADTVSNLPGVTRVENQLTVKGAVPAIDSDAWLLTKIKTTLLFHRNVSAMTTVAVVNGVVTLSGVANSEAEKELTSEYVSDIEGVREVNNVMSVTTMPQEATATLGERIDDASITAQVKMLLLSHRSTSALRTSVKTTDGVVTLSGEAKNQAEIELAGKLSEDSKGVRRVDNMMTVRQ